MTGDRSPSLAASEWLQYFAFAVAGIGCALPGALLPAMLRAWHPQDRRAGLLFLMISCGSALGALALARRLKHSFVLGFALITVAAIGWSRATTVPGLFGFFWGFGLGMVMTSISLLRQHAGRSLAVQMVRLNLLWALGACCCPALMTHALRASSPRGVFVACAAACALLTLAGLLLLPSVVRQTSSQAVSMQSFVREQFGLARVPLLLVLATVLATGIEASGGAWLATYAERSRHGTVMVIAAPTALWAGLLASRVLGSLAAAGPLLDHALRALLVLVAIAAFGLLLPFAVTLLLSAFLLGFGLGPVYPSLLARVMAYRSNGAIFFLCGVASAVLPWLTGVLSTHYASLRMGLLVATAGSVLLLVSGLAVAREDNGGFRNATSTSPS